MKVEEVTPVAGADAWLPGAQFAAACRISVAGRPPDAPHAPPRMLGASPLWGARGAPLAPVRLRLRGRAGADAPTDPPTARR